MKQILVCQGWHESLYAEDGAKTHLVLVNLSTSGDAYKER